MDDMIEIYQNYLDMIDEERNDIARSASEKLFEHLTEFYDEESVLKTYINMFSVLCSVDGVISQEEHELFSFVTNTHVSYDEFFEVMKFGANSEMIENFFEFADSQGDEFIGNLFVLAICVFACKGTITVEEQEFIYEYFM